MSDNLQFCVNRTLGGTIFEALIAIILLATWVVNFFAGNFLFTHAMFITCVDTALCIYSLYAAYHPLTMVSMPMNITTTAQLVVLVIYTRIMTIGLALLGLGIAIGRNLSHKPEVGMVIIYVSIGIILTNTLLCLFRVYSLRDRSKKTRWRIK